MASLTIRGRRAKVIDLSRLSVVMRQLDPRGKWTGLINMAGCGSHPGRTLDLRFHLPLSTTMVTQFTQLASRRAERMGGAPKCHRGDDV